MDLQLDQLRTLSSVVAGGTFDAAAAELRITPSAVSQRIRALETAVGRVLLQRTKPVQPTESGEVVLRLARQLTLLTDDALVALGERGSGDSGPVTLPVVINADSLNAWVLPVLAEVSTTHHVCFDVHREDQDHSLDLLRSGRVMAAITSSSTPVQGCTVRRLGRMRYRPMASPALVERWFPDGPTVAALTVAPVVAFDRLDALQDRYLRRRTRRTLSPPRHFVPAAAEFAESVRLGLGWGMLPDLQSRDLVAAGEVVELDPGRTVDVDLYWQQWKLRSPLLDVLAGAILAAAQQHLR